MARMMTITKSPQTRTSDAKDAGGSTERMAEKRVERRPTKRQGWWRLLSRLKLGLLTPKMLEDLQKEWLRNVKKDDPQNGKDDDDY